ncbi:transcriptional regulator [Pandoraea horticolens]|uniref:Transcriptional regulator n=1 Tax=Pandoraea horticolens TaxID=2508298 RepID=A0A5E4VNQ8_9BURK|nr:XRE family transcriptional regulator [Pandoraea horticolens]VVE13942.1 transcriptional regulator [Pandoraea horticolens]
MKEQSTSVSMQPGKALRALRTKLGMTLHEVSERTGLSVSTVSKLEMGRASLSFEKLFAMSEGLGVEMSELLGALASTSKGAASPAPIGRRVIQRAGDGLPLKTVPYGQLYPAVERLHKQLIPIVADVYATTIEEFVAAFGDLTRHAGEEFAYVLDGEVEFHSELYAPVRLKKGESIYFDSSMGHAYLKASDAPCRVLCVCTNAGDREASPGHLKRKERSSI